MKSRIAAFLFQLLIVIAAVFASDRLSKFISFIPRWIARLPSANYTAGEFWTVLYYFLVVYAVVLLTSRFLTRRWHPAEAESTVDQLFVFLVSWAAASLIVFVTTSVAFDPQFIIGILVCWAFLITTVHVAARFSAKSAKSLVPELFGAIWRRSFSLSGVAMLLFALSPGILAKLFASNRDVANVITQIRIRVSGSFVSHDWKTANALNGRTFLQPIQVRFPPGNAKEIYILERNGKLLRMPWGTDGEPEIVLDITARVGYVEIENGALGFDFHPKFGTAGIPEGSAIFLYYTSVINQVQTNYLSRFSTSARTVEERSASEQNLILWNRKDDGFHNGGSVLFGPDGFLYVAVGEMSDAKSHQRIDASLTSAILRIDVDQKGGTVSREIRRQPKDGKTSGYFIPSDNPFANVTDALGEFWAIGLRNPFRISFDPENGNLWAGEVGSTTWEEVNLIKRGHNYQFPFIEGRQTTKHSRPAEVRGTEKGPIYTYLHTAFERAVIGGIVYRGTRHPTLRGQYVFGDNYSGKIYTLPATDEERDKVREVGQANQFAQRGITSFASSPDGEILITTLGRASSPSGEVLKLVPASTVTTDSEQPKTADSPVTEAEARSLFGSNCSRCHGAQGSGDGPDSKLLNVQVPDMSQRAFQSSRSDSALYAVIHDGGAAHGKSPLMPPWGQALSKDEIQAIVRVIRTFHAHGSGTSKEN